MPDENDVQITRHKRILENIRGETNGAQQPSTQSGAGVSDGYAQGGARVDRQNPTGSSGTGRRDEERTRGAAKIDGTAQGLHKGVRPPERPPINTDKSTRDGTRQDDRERVARPPYVFRLKNPFSGKSYENERLFTDREAEGEFERLRDVYFQASGFLDDILEIIVKDHEPVQIWQLIPEEADTLASMHLQRAKYDKKAAASARQLLALYDRLYLYILGIPRAKLTAEHIKEHKGFSFR